MEKLKVAHTVTYRGSQYPNAFDIETDGVAIKSPSVTSVQLTGPLATRTDNNTGDITLQPGHGLVDGDFVDVYWSTGSRRHMLVNMTGDSCNVDAGNGDNLPDALTQVTVVKSSSEALSVVGNSMEALVLYSPVRGAITFLDGSNAILYSVELEAGVTLTWLDPTGATNPLAGVTAASIRISHLSSSAQVVEAMAFVN